uniref:Uncharacterized protein n=1 Tax=Vespula pensylvanica TaxID=30213 RepID=A0A834P5J9_VESPE|nr:hypothetical protein H0235_007385 [Vespula pensylvanica]
MKLSDYNSKTFGIQPSPEEQATMSSYLRRKLKEYGSSTAPNSSKILTYKYSLQHKRTRLVKPPDECAKMAADRCRCRAVTPNADQEQWQILQSDLLLTNTQSCLHWQADGNASTLSYFLGKRMMRNDGKDKDRKVESERGNEKIIVDL